MHSVKCKGKKRKDRFQYVYIRALFPIAPDNYPAVTYVFQKVFSKNTGLAFFDAVKSTRTAEFSEVLKL